ncbi:GNAT family N-acetyltransferase [Halomonas sp. V046]|uniref:GNAT family N-acetyltransferase n=1 Tax=Halomonas sp. V046 TaxID=3459611 RepID=UPI0040451578
MSQPRLVAVESIASVPKAAWNALVGDDYPFLRHEFLLALEASGAVGSETGWLPRHQTLWCGERLVGALPYYLKGHSYGEYVFDWGWADAWERAGGDYYPKGLSAIPFTPVPGPRLLLADELDPVAARRAIARTWELDERLSSWHLLFAEDDEVAAWREARPELVARHGVQFQWRDQGFGDFEGYLAAMTSRRRKEVRRERRRVGEQGIVLRRLMGGEIGVDDMTHFFGCYRITYLERGRQGYLDEAFFQRLLAEMPDSLVLIQALVEGRPVAAALCLQGARSLYGRYWGSEVMADCLHFETCYYQGIEHCLEHGLTLFDPGTQGEHKVARGFAPRRLTSLHHIADPRLRDAVARFCREESAGVGAYATGALRGLPFRSS